MESNQNHATVQTNGVSTALPAAMGEGGGYVPMITAGFSFGQSAKARSLGYEEEVSPTIRGGEGGNQKPCVISAVDVYNQTLCGEVSPSITAACGGSNTSGPKLMCKNPNDPQSKRVFDPDGIGPTLNSGTTEGMNIVPSVICAAVDCRNGTESDINGTLQAKSNGGTSYNLNNVVRESARTFDARGNGAGSISPTITGDHQNRVTDYTALVVELDDENIHREPLR